MNATSTASGADRRIVVAVVLLALASAFGYPLLDRALNP